MKRLSLFFIIGFGFSALAKTGETSSSSSSPSPKLVELSVGVGSDLALAKGWSAAPGNITPTSQPSNATTGVLVGDARLLFFFPHNEFIGLGMDFSFTGQSSSTYTSTDANLSKYTKYQTSCSSSNALLAINLWDTGHVSWWRHSGRLLGMYAIRANCALDFTATGLSTYEDTATAKSYGVAFDLVDTFFNKIQLGLEVGYRYYKSNTLVDPQSQPVLDSANNPVTVNLSAPYLQVNLGLEF